MRPKEGTLPRFPLLIPCTSWKLSLQRKAYRTVLFGLEGQLRKKRETGNGAMEADGQRGRIGAQITMAKLVKSVSCQVTLLGIIIPAEVCVPPSANIPLT